MKKIQRGNGGKYKRIGQKVGNMVVIMQIISVIFAVAMCVTMFRSLTTKILKERCTDGTNMLAYLLSQADEDTDMKLSTVARPTAARTRMSCWMSWRAAWAVNLPSLRATPGPTPP